MIADFEIRAVFEAIQKTLPDVEAIVADGGMTVAVRLPGKPGAPYIAREYKPERDGRIGYYVISGEKAIEAVIELIQQ